MCPSQHQRPHNVGVLAYEGAQLAAVYGLVDLLHTANRLARDDVHCDTQLDVHAIAVGKRLARPGSTLTALVVPPSLGEDVPPVHATRIIAWTQARYEEGTSLCSVCAGAFLLAQTGLLDGRPATTHWALADPFRARFPAVGLDTDKLLIDDGDIVTAGGLMAWIDLGLRLVDRLLGRSVMLTTARFFLVDPGGREQRFYSGFSPNLTHGDPAILAVQRWLPAHSSETVRVSMMAALAKLGERTFLRRFHHATGLKPNQYLQRLRMGTARGLLEQSHHTVDEVSFSGIF